MNRLLVYAVGLAVVALFAFGIFVFATGGQRPSLLDTPVVQEPQSSSEPTPPGTSSEPEQPTIPEAPIAETTPEAAARFDAWAKPLRDRDLVITTQSVAERGETMNVRGMTVTAAKQSLDWSWTIETVQIFDKEQFHIQAMGKTSVSLTTLTGNATWSGKAGGLGIAIQQDARGVAGRSLIVRLNDFEIAGDGDVAPLTLRDGQLRLVLQGGTGLLPPGTKLALRLSDLVLPAAEGSAVGSKVKAFTTEFTLHRALKGYSFPDILTFLEPGIDGGVRLGTLAVDWGPLHFIGEGIFNISQSGLLGGRLDVKVAEPLSLFDAIAALGGVAAQPLADAYGAVLLELGRNSEEPSVPFTIAMDGGAISLLGQSRGIADISLGEAPRMMTGFGENAAESVSADLPQGSIRQQ